MAASWGALCARRAPGDRRPAQRLRAFLIGVGVATLVACSMFYFKAVTVKLLPFDNKSEVQLVRRHARGHQPGGHRARCSNRPPRQRAPCPKSPSMEAYAGTSAPFNFNGLVRHYFLRDAARNGRSDGHAAAQGRPRRAPAMPIAVDLRERLKPTAAARGRIDQGGRNAARAAGARDAAGRNLWPGRGDPPRSRRAGREDLQDRSPTSSMSTTASASRGPQLRLVPDRAKLDYYGLSERQVFDSDRRAAGRPDGRLCAARRWAAIRCRSRSRSTSRSAAGRPALAATPVAVTHGGGAPQLIQLGELVDARMERGEPAIFRRDGRGATWSRPNWPDAMRRRSTACSRSTGRSMPSTGPGAGPAKARHPPQRPARG